MISFKKFEHILVDRSMKKKELIGKDKISPATMAKLTSGKNVNIQTIDKLCELLDVQPGDLMEYIREEKPTEEIS